MKILTAMLLACLSCSGAACSQGPAEPPGGGADTGTIETASTPEPASAPAPVTGTLNLNIGARSDTPDGPLLGAGALSADPASRSTGLIGSGVFGGGDFLEAPEISIGTDPGSADTQDAGSSGPAAEDLIRLPE